MMNWLFVALFMIGMVLIVVPILSSIKVRKRLRVSAWRAKRQEDFQEYILRVIKKENEKQSNFKLRRKLKLAGYPFGLDVFKYRVLQMILPTVAALVVVLLYAMQNAIQGYVQPFPISFFLFLVLITFATPFILVTVLAYQRKEALTEDIVKFSHRLVVSISDNIPLYYAVKRAGRTCTVLKPYVDDLLVDWLDDPRKAIKEFEERVGVYEVVPLTNTLLSSWSASQEKIVELFQAQIRNIDTMRDFRIKKRIEVSPLRVTLVIIIPFLVAGGLILLPWYMQAMDLMKQSF
ncbi:hypothetical protein [Niallia taxi]|uniref:hypothetical protein n=1 Tax=Niallia taxi TaxID=2499688 RepID=UPI0015F4F60A|nr:hypothetical protein [Niallia taxi]